MTRGDQTSFMPPIDDACRNSKDESDLVVLGALAKRLSDDDIKVLAGYYAGMR